MSNIIDDIKKRSQDIEITEDMIPEFIIVDDVTHSFNAYFADGRIEHNVVATEYIHLWEEIKLNLEPLIIKANDLN